MIDFDYDESQVIYDSTTGTLEIIDDDTPPEHIIPDDYEFSYNGTASSAFHVYYIPDAAARWFDGPDFDVYDSEVSWHHGGYYYGNSVKNRVFTLPCYYEEITKEQREQIRRWLHRDTSGQFMFLDRQFVYWNVRPTKIIKGTEYLDCGYYSGTFEIEFTAYDPFGYLTRKSNDGNEDDTANDYCDLIDTSDMPAAPTTSSRTFNVYNPGREVCGLSIAMSGTVEHPIEFLNTDNQTRCIFQSLPTNDLKVAINGDTGKVITYVANDIINAENGYAYHDRGVIRLNPGMNTIMIMEKNDNGNWVTPTTLALTSIAIDYSPRIL